MVYNKLKVESSRFGDKWTSIGLHQLRGREPFMTEREARVQAEWLGALKPQSFIENATATWIEHTRGQRWCDTPKAQQRLKLWTEAILTGRNPKTCVG